MNKSHRRAIQKHRAQKAKFELRRQESGDQSGARLRSGGAPSPAAPRPKSPPRRQAGAEGGE